MCGGDRTSGAQSRHEDERGFTLIELLVVVLIIGVIAGVAIPSVFAVRRRAWQAELQSVARAVAMEVHTGALVAGYDAVVPDTAALQGVADAFQRAAGDPVTVVLEDVAPSAYCFTATHALLTGGARVVYDTDAGGLVFSEDGTATCV